MKRFTPAHEPLTSWLDEEDRMDLWTLLLDFICCDETGDRTKMPVGG